MAESMISESSMSSNHPNKLANIESLQRARRLAGSGSRTPRVLVLVGIPGSGKTTFAEQLVSAGWGVRVSQDDLGTRIKCEREMVESLLDMHNVIIDRCNFDKAQRKHWRLTNEELHARNLDTDYAKARGCEAGVVVFATSFGECVRRVLARTNHPTLSGGSNESELVVRRMAESMVFPDRSEGFQFCRVVRNQPDFVRVIHEIIDAERKTRPSRNEFKRRNRNPLSYKMASFTDEHYVVKQTLDIANCQRGKSRMHDRARSQSKRDEPKCVSVVVKKSLRTHQSSVSIASAGWVVLGGFAGAFGLAVRGPCFVLRKA